MKGISRVIAQPKPATIMMVIMVMEVVEEEDDEVEVEVEVEAVVEVDVEDDKVDAVVVEAIVIMVTEAEVAATSALLGNLTAIKPKPILAEISVVSAEIRAISSGNAMLSMTLMAGLCMQTRRRNRRVCTVIAAGEVIIGPKAVSLISLSMAKN